MTAEFEQCVSVGGSKRVRVRPARACAWAPPALPLLCPSSVQRRHILAIQPPTHLPPKVRHTLAFKKVREVLSAEWGVDPADPEAFAGIPAEELDDLLMQQLRCTAQKARRPPPHAAAHAPQCLCRAARGGLRAAATPPPPPPAPAGGARADPPRWSRRRRRGRARSAARRRGRGRSRSRRSSRRSRGRARGARGACGTCSCGGPPPSARRRLGCAFPARSPLPRGSLAQPSTPERRRRLAQTSCAPPRPRHATPPQDSASVPGTFARSDAPQALWSHEAWEMRTVIEARREDNAPLAFPPRDAH